MTKKYSYTACLLMVIILITSSISQPLSAQTPEVEVTGVEDGITESGTGQALGMVSISVAATGYSTGTDSTGAFTLTVPDLQAQIILNMPGYTSRNLYLNGRDHINISLVREKYNYPR